MKRFCTRWVESREFDQQSVLDKSLSTFPLYDFRSQVSRLGEEFVRKSRHFAPFGTKFQPLEERPVTDYDYREFKVVIRSVCDRHSHAGSADNSHQHMSTAGGKSFVSRQYRSMATASRIYRAFDSSVARLRTVGVATFLSKSGSS
jgi:hypothetical protein